MSRIGKKEIKIPEDVSVSVDGQQVLVKGSKGELKYVVHDDIAVKFAEGVLSCEIARPGKQATALWGTTRARLANMVIGVSTGWKKELEIQGVGYKAKVSGDKLEMALGYSHPVIVPAPEGIKFNVDQNIISVEGVDKVAVGQVAADIRKKRKPEPYKGKGVRYVGEQVRRKVGKVVGAAE